VAIRAWKFGNDIALAAVRVNEFETIGFEKTISVDVDVA